jgi:hypothetical protein
MLLLIAILILLAWASIYIAILSNKVSSHISLPSYHYSDLSEMGYNYVAVSGTLVSTSKDGAVSMRAN